MKAYLIFEKFLNDNNISYKVKKYMTRSVSYNIIGLNSAEIWEKLPTNIQEGFNRKLSIRDAIINLDEIPKRYPIVWLYNNGFFKGD